MLKSKEVTMDFYGEWAYDYNGKYVCYLRVSLNDSTSEYVGYGSNSDIAFNRVRDIAMADGYIRPFANGIYWFEKWDYKLDSYKSYSVNYSY